MPHNSFVRVITSECELVAHPPVGEDVRKKALMRLEYEGLSKCEAVTAAGARLAT